MASYSNDPRWIVARYAGADRDGRPFKRGERIFYYPLTKTILAGDAAESAAAEFDGARMAEESGTW